MQSREYQEVQVQNVIDEIESHQTVLCQLPTGGGKTVEFSLIIKKFLQKLVEIDQGPVLILVHREELLKQTAKAIREVLGWEPCLITSGTSRFYMARVYVGMVESTLPRLHMIVHPSLIIIDECHIQNFNKIHKQFPSTKIIGFSATPISASKREPMNKYYERLVTGPSIKQLINLGYLAQNITRAPANSVDASGIQFDRLIGDYNQRDLATTYRMTSNVTNCVDQYWKFCLHKKTLIFNVNIEHSKEVTACFVAMGLKSRHLDASSSQRPSNDPRCKTEREEIFLWFKETPDAVLNSVMIPTMGFDEPTVEAIILNYSTLSLVKFVQTCGRGSRIVDNYFIEKFHADYPYELKLKDHFHIIDLGQNWKNFGDWNDERDWRWIFNHPDLPGDGVAPVKTCPSCEALVHAAVRVCGYCGHEFARKKVVQQDIEEMVLITKGIDLNVLNERAEKKYKYYPFFEMAVDIVNNMFQTYGSHPSKNMVDRCFKTYYGLCIQWYNKTLAKQDDEIGDITDSGWHIKKARNNFNSLILRRNKSASIIEDEVPYELVRQIFKSV